jgi:hypothetical protein
MVNAGRIRKGSIDRRKMGLGLAAALKSARTPEDFLLSPAFQQIDVKQLLVQDVRPRAERYATLQAKGSNLTEAERVEMVSVGREITEMVKQANKLVSLQVTARRRSLAAVEHAQRSDAVS